MLLFGPRLVPGLTKGANHLLLQIQRAFRVRDQRCRAVQIVAATWPPSQPLQLGIVASLVAGVSRIRMNCQYRVMRRVLRQLRQYSLSRAARRRELHIRRCATTIPPTACTRCSRRETHTLRPVHIHTVSRCARCRALPQGEVWTLHAPASWGRCV